MRGSFCGEAQIGDRVEGRFKGHKVDQEQMENLRARFHVVTGTPCGIRLPVSLGMILTGEILIPSRGREGEVLWQCLCIYI